MELSAAKQQEYMRRILIARMTVLSRNGFFGLLLMHMKFALDPSIGTAATDGERIYFDPKFLDKLSDRELVFILMHEIMINKMITTKIISTGILTPPSVSQAKACHPLKK